MSYKRLGNQLQNYQQSVPDWLQQFLGEYESDPYQSTVLDELTRRSDQNFGQSMGQMASYFGGAGRDGSGIMGRSMGDAAAENAQRLRGDMGGLMSQDRQSWLQRALEASGILGGIQQTGMGGMAQGYSADQSRKATIGAANIGADASRYQTDAYRDIGMGNLGMNKDFGTWDRQYQSDMMPYNQLNMLGTGAGGLMGAFGQNNSSGTNTNPGTGSKGGNALSGAVQGGMGGGMMGWGMNSGGGSRPSSRPSSNPGWGFGMNNPGWGGIGPSDIKLKDNVVRHDVDYLPGVPFSTWDWKSDGSHGAGVVAQDMKALYPDRVININETLHVRYG